MRVPLVDVALHLPNSIIMNRLLLLLSLFIGMAVQAQTTIVNQPVINDYAAVTAIDFCTNSMNVANNAEQNFAVGDKVLIVQMKGAAISSALNSTSGNVEDYQEAGSYEYNFVKSINFGNINGLQFENTLLHPYDINGSIQVIKVPEYVNVEFQATLTCIPWDGSIGGIVVFEASGNVSLQANIFLDETGFRGGAFSNDNSCYTPVGGFQGYVCLDVEDCGGFKGEGSGLAYDNQFKGRGRNGSGAGGGNDHNGGGAGGGNGGNGGDGGDNDTNTQFCDGSGGLGGQKNDMTPTNNRILMGGAGGAGDSNNNSGTPGGNAGGSLIMKAASLTSNGFTISSLGGSAGLATGDGAGGGGAGGTVILDVATFTDAISIDLSGGNGGDNSDNTNCPAVGGGGAGGSVWVSSAVIPTNVSVNAPGGNKGVYTSGLCGGLDIGAEDGEDGGFSFSYTPMVAQEEFIQTVLTADTGAIICVGDDTPLTSSIVSSENPDFSWVYNSASISTDANLSVAPTAAGVNEYVATATWEVFGQSCIEEESVSIVVKNPNITIVVSPTQPVAVGDPVFLNAVVNPPNPSYTYQWEPDYVDPNDDRNAVVEPLESGDFCITVTDEIGCEKTECAFVPVLLAFTGAPNAFSPNGDNQNDIFQVLPDPFLKQNSLKIYNRWGDLLYESKELFQWDGKSNGEMQNVDTYIWVVEFEHRNTGEKTTQDGYVTLIR